MVGSALVRELLIRGIPVLALVREGSPGGRRLADYVKDLPGAGDLLCMRSCSLSELKSFSDDTLRQWDAFFHLGWSGTKGKERFDMRIHLENVSFALDALDLAERLGCRTFVGAGSQAEYGRKDGPLAPETCPHPENAYGAGKLAAGISTRIAAEKKGIRHIWTRILSVYGPNDGERTLITYLVRSLLSGERPVTTAGEQLWDYLWSRDAAKALISAAERGRDGKVYLVASGQCMPLRKYIEIIRDILNPEAEIGIGEVPYAKGQVMHLEADISETVRDTMWRPETSFPDGIREMAARMTADESK